jgi:hypothetical protein
MGRVRRLCGFIVLVVLSAPLARAEMDAGVPSAPVRPAATPKPQPAANQDELGVANATASSTYGQKAERLVASNTIDGNVATVWKPDPKKKSPQWIQLDFGDRVQIDRCTIRLASQAAGLGTDAESMQAKLVLADKKSVAVDGFAATSATPIDVAVGGKTSRTIRLVIDGGPHLPAELGVAELSCFGTRKLELSPREQSDQLDQKYEKEHKGRSRPRPRVPSDCRTEKVSDEFLNSENGMPIVYSQTLVAYYASCGSPCGYSVFVDCPSGKVSESHWIPIAVDPDRELLLNGETKLTVRSIFTDEVLKTLDRPAFKAAVDLSYFVDARFLPSGALKLWYADLRGRPVVEVVTVP